MDRQSVGAHLEQVLASPLFRKADRQARFLRFVVETALDSANGSLKEFDIGIAVYDRRGDYDPRADPIVRVEAARLRARLREYYASEPDSPVRIDLPKGGYLPEFVAGLPAAAEARPAAGVAVPQFRNLSAEAGSDFFSDGLTEEVLHQLAAAGIRVIPQAALARIGSAAPSRWLLEGSVRTAGTQIRVTLHVVDLQDGSTCISKVYNDEMGEVFAVQEGIARALAADVAAAIAM